MPDTDDTRPVEQIDNDVQSFYDGTHPRSGYDTGIQDQMALAGELVAETDDRYYLIVPDRERELLVQELGLSDAEFDRVESVYRGQVRDKWQESDVHESVTEDQRVVGSDSHALVLDK